MIVDSGSRTQAFRAKPETTRAKLKAFMEFNRQGGFTLVEAMLAIAIFAFISVSSYAILDNIQRTSAQSEKKSSELALMQKVSWQIAKDFRHMVNRPVLDEDGRTRAAFLEDSDDYIFEFTRHSWANPLGWPRSPLQRVAYSIDYHPEYELPGSEFEGDETLYLVRHFWPVLDRGFDIEPVKQAMVANVTDFYLRYYNPDETEEPWQTNIVLNRATVGTTPSNTSVFNLPYAVEVNIAIEEDSLYSYVMPVRTGGN